MKVGDIHKSNGYGEYEIKEIITTKRIRIKFTLTGTEKWVIQKNILQGSIRDPWFPRTYGVGYSGNAKVSVNGKAKKSHSVWVRILERCYTKDERLKTYWDVTVCDEWLNYENFEKWYDENHKEGYHIDKDFTIIGSKVYSPETCTFMPHRINSLIGKNTFDNKERDKSLPCGVTFNKGKQKYEAKYRNGSEAIHLGTFPTAESAFSEYKRFKEKHIREVVTEEFELGNITETVYNNLMNYEVTP